MQLAGLANKVAVVTGASAGIGRAVAERLARERTRLALVDDDVAALAQLMDDLAAAAPRVVAYAFPNALANPAQAASLAAGVEQALGGVNFLINAATSVPIDITSGGSVLGSAPALESIDDDEWGRTLAGNLTTTFRCCRAFVPLLKARGGGRIVNLSSEAARGGGLRAGAHYAAAMGGVLGLTRALAVELGPHAITVNTVAPGHIAHAAPEGWQRAPQLLQLQATHLATTPLGRVGRPAEVAAVVALLCSQAGSYLNGVTIDVNGGRYFAP